MKKNIEIVNKTTKGLKWNSVNILAQTIINFAIITVMARLLSPVEFGLLTLTMIFIGLAEKFSTMGVGPYLIQKDTLLKTHIKSAFTISLVLGVLLYLLFYLSTPIITFVLDENKLIEILPFIAIIFLFQCVLAVNQSLLIRRMEFKKLFIIETLSIVIGKGVIPIILAVQGYGIWSLICGIIVYSFLKSILLQFVIKAPISLRFNKEEYKDILWYGSGVSSLGVLNYLANNIDNFIIGRYLGTSSLGLYNRSAQLMKLPLTKVSQTLSNVLFSSFSRYQDDKENLESSYLSAVSYITIITYPILLGMIIGADYIILGLYGEEWFQAIVIFKVLCLAGFFKVIFNLAGAVTKATRNVFKEAKKQLVYMLLVAIGSFIGVFYGIEYVALAAVIASFYMYVSMTNLCLKIIDSTWKKFLMAQMPGVLISILFSFIILVTKISMDIYLFNLSMPIKLIIFIIFCSIILILIIKLIPNKIIKSKEIQAVKGLVSVLNYKAGEKKYE